MFGPATAAEVLPLVTKCVLAGSIVFSDGLIAYKNNLKKMGYQHDYVNHQKGEYAKTATVFDSVVHINSIEDAWSCYKNFLRGKKGIKSDRHPLHLYEFMWRQNIKLLPLRLLYSMKY